MKRLLAAAVATAAAASLTLTTVPAQAAAKPGLLSAKDARSFTGVAMKGKPARVNVLTVPATCTRNTKMRINMSRQAVYVGSAADGTSVTVQSSAYRAKSKAQAKKLLKKITKVATCSYGRSVTGSVPQLSKVSIPKKLGKPRVGHRVTRTYTGSPIVSNEQYLAVRKKNNTVVFVTVVGTMPYKSAAPLLRKAVRKA